MQARWTTLWALGIVLVLLAGCGGAGPPLKKGGDSYHRADYRGAMVQWRYLEAREPEMNPKGRVRYLVFRGLTHYRLYQRSKDPSEETAALHYLARGQAEYDAGKARWLDAETVSDMKGALSELALRKAGSRAGAGPVVVVQAPPPTQIVVPATARAAPPAPAPAPAEE